MAEPDLLALITELGKLARREHYESDESSALSCPKSPDGQRFAKELKEEFPDDECNCDAPEHNARVEEVLKAAQEAASLAAGKNRELRSLLDMCADNLEQVYRDIKANTIPRLDEGFSAEESVRDLTPDEWERMKLDYYRIMEGKQRF